MQANLNSKPLLIYILVFVASFFCLKNATAQMVDKMLPIEDTKSDTIIEKKTYLIADKMPEFPGGIEAMMEYVKNNLQYPPLVQATRAQGRVIIRFIVGDDGEIEDIDILSNNLAFEDEISQKTINIMGKDKNFTIKEIQFIAAQEAMRVVKSMPKWEPGIKENKPVSVYFTMPFSFRLK